MRDPYDVLGVAKTAGAAEIKSAFRKLAKKYHPDQSKEPRPKSVSPKSARHTKSSATRRSAKAFDRGEIDAEGKPRAPQFEGFGSAASQERPAGIAQLRLRLRRRRVFGRGRFDRSGHPVGTVRRRPHAGAQPVHARRGYRRLRRRPADDDCARRLDPGRPADRPKTLDVAVPAGIEEGKSIRLRGQGHPGPRGGPPGDVMVTIRYAPHPLFKVEGRDLRLDLPITLYEAVLGARVRAPTLSGEVEVSIAPGASGGRVLRLRGKGLPAGAEQPAGDLLATLRIVLPKRARRRTQRLDAQAARSKTLRPSLGRRLKSFGRRIEEAGRNLQSDEASRSPTRASPWPRHVHTIALLPRRLR